jgi:hypothetical protein
MSDACAICFAPVPQVRGQHRQGGVRVCDDCEKALVTLRAKMRIRRLKTKGYMKRAPGESPKRRAMRKQVYQMALEVFGGDLRRAGKIASNLISAGDLFRAVSDIRERVQAIEQRLSQSKKE